MNRHVSLKWVLLPETKSQSAGTFVHLTDEKVKHLRKVLRLEWGTPLLVTDGAGTLYEGQLEQVNGSGGVRLNGIKRQDPTPASLKLVLCLPKNTTMDWVVEKAVECGVTSILPVVSSRSVVKPKSGEEQKYVRRWQSIMDAALEQSERTHRPLIEAPQDWGSWIHAKSAAPNETRVVFVSELREQNLPEKELLTKTWKKLESAKGSPIAVLVGPEGGFSEKERQDLSNLGYEELSLGNTVLRVETAVITSLAWIQASRNVY